MNQVEVRNGNAAPGREVRDSDADEGAWLYRSGGAHTRAHPTAGWSVVHRRPRVKSAEGLLSYFEADDDSPGTSPSNIEETPEKESPTDDKPALVQRAKSVDLGKGHARHLSAGAAKLLDIPAKRASVDHKRASSASEP